MLRQQAKREDNIYKSLADYVIPSSAQQTDYLGAFVVTAGADLENLKKEFEDKNDTYSAVLLQTLTDRLAEATAEYLHKMVREEYWGYAANENLSIEDMFRVKYQGIRPAIGYPSIPDQLQNHTLDKLLDMLRHVALGLLVIGGNPMAHQLMGEHPGHPFDAKGEGNMKSAKQHLKEKQYNDWKATLSPQVKKAYNQKRAYWDQLYNPLIGKAQDTLYNWFLKGNQVKDGSNNYANVITLLINIKNAGYI